jgi:TolB-like protein/class 3 adenylate cyclase
MNEQSDDRTGKRRMAAVMAADVAGYSRLMGADEEATIADLGRARAVFRESVGRHDGRVVDTAGDSVLAVFESIIEAVRCALAVQESLTTRNADVPDDRRMQFRIGVHFGDIVEQDDGTIYGDGVNIAARLEGLAEPGGLTVSGTVHEHVEGKLGIGLSDLGEQEVKNIERPVRAWRVAAAGHSAPSRARKTKHPLTLVTALVAIVVAGFAAWQIGQIGTPDEPADPANSVLARLDVPVIAVMLFDNASHDPEQDIFALGLTENIITRLSRFDGFAVVARNSTAQYAGQAIDVRVVGRELGAKYLVEGSVQILDTKIRVSAQLLNAEDGTHVWAETYDRDLTTANVFEIQDDITARISGVIGSATGIVGRAELEAIKDRPPESLEAWECSLRVIAYYDEISPDGHAKVRDCLERAVEKEPNNATAWIDLGGIILEEYRVGFNPLANSIDRALDAVRRGIALAPDNEMGQLNIAEIHFARGEVELFHAAADKALALNSNNADILSSLGHKMINAGFTDRGIALMRRAVVLNPNHPEWYHFAFFNYYWQMDDMAAALEAIQKVDMPDFFWTHVCRAEVYSRLGRLDEARGAVASVLELYPEFGANFWNEVAVWNGPTNVADSYANALREAGMEIPERPVPTQ